MIKVHDGDGAIGYYAGLTADHVEKLRVTMHNGKVQELEVLASKGSTRLYAEKIDPALWVHKAFSLKGEAIV